MSRRWGIVEKLSSGNWRARYTYKKQRYTAPVTFRTKGAAEVWLTKQRASIEEGRWVDPAEQSAEEKRKSVTFADYAKNWIKTRTTSRGKPLSDRTKYEYTRYLETGLDDFAKTKITAIKQSDVETWWAKQLATGKHTLAANRYQFFHAVMKRAVRDKLIPENPCQIEGASTLSTGQKTTIPTNQQLLTMYSEAETDMAAALALAAGGGLRGGEIRALTRADLQPTFDESDQLQKIDVKVTKSINDRGVDKINIKDPKSQSSIRTVPIYGQEAQIIWKRAKDLSDSDLILPSIHGGFMHYSSFHTRWDKIRTEAGFTGRFHDLRGYQATIYAQAGATVKETMDRLGHSTSKAAMKYQHGTETRKEELARKVSRMQ